MDSHPDCVDHVDCCHGTYYHTDDGSSTIHYTDPVNDACLHMQHDDPSDGAHCSILGLLNEFMSRGQCDDAGSELAGEAGVVQQKGEAGSEPVADNDSPNSSSDSMSESELDTLKAFWTELAGDVSTHTMSSQAVDTVDSVGQCGSGDGEVVMHMKTRHHKKSGVSGKVSSTPHSRLIARTKELLAKCTDKNNQLKGIKLFSPKASPEERTRAPHFKRQCMLL